MFRWCLDAHCEANSSGALLRYLTGGHVSTAIWLGSEQSVFALSNWLLPNALCEHACAM